jgi:hypothetical membrane protein
VNGSLCIERGYFNSRLILPGVAGCLFDKFIEEVNNEYRALFILTALLLCLVPLFTIEKFKVIYGSLAVVLLRIRAELKPIFCSLE